MLNYVKLILLAIAIIAFVISGRIHNSSKKHHVYGAYDGCGDCSQAAKDLAWSLDNERNLWSVDSFIITRTDNICLWHANGMDGFSGGRDSICSEWQPSEEDKTLLYRAYNRWAEKDIRNDE